VTEKLKMTAAVYVVNIGTERKDGEDEEENDSLIRLLFGAFCLHQPINNLAVDYFSSLTDACDEIRLMIFFLTVSCLIRRRITAHIR
jgi:hypothetical protein